MSSSQQPSSSSIPSRHPFVLITNQLDTTRATRGDSLNDDDSIPSTSKAALPGLWKAGVQSLRKLTQKIRPPTEEELFYDELATFELPQKTHDASPPICTTAKDIRILLQTIDLEALQTPPGLGATPQILSAVEVESFGSTRVLPSLIIKARDRVGSSKLIDGKPGYFYLDPAAGTDQKSLRMRPLRMIEKRAVNFRQDSSKFGEQQFYLEHAVSVLVEEGKDCFRYVGNYFLTPTNTFLSKMEWIITVHETKKKFLVNRYRQTHRCPDNHLNSTEKYTTHQVRKWYNLGLACPLTIMYPAKHNPLAPVNEALGQGRPLDSSQLPQDVTDEVAVPPYLNPHDDSNEEVKRASNATLKAKVDDQHHLEDTESPQEADLTDSVIVRSFLDFDDDDEEEISRYHQNHTSNYDEDDALQSQLLSYGAVEFNEHLQKYLHGLRTLEQEDPQAFEELKALGAQLEDEPNAQDVGFDARSIFASGAVGMEAGPSEEVDIASNSFLNLNDQEPGQTKNEDELSEQLEGLVLSEDEEDLGRQLREFRDGLSALEEEDPRTFAELDDFDAHL